ncbi:MAG: hypothetical protein AB1805_14325 [Nitrospirota bacterium]
MRNKKAVDKATIAWWAELKNYKKDNWCCTLLKESAMEEHFKFEFEDVVRIKFDINFCCHCGSPVREGVTREKDGKEDWCCRLLRNINLERIEFRRAGAALSPVQFNHCFYCGKELKKQNDEGKAERKEKDDKRG